MDGRLPFLLLAKAAQRLAINGDHVGWSAGLRRNPTDETRLKFFRVQRREDVAQMVVRRFFVPKRAISVKVSAPARTASRQSNSTSPSG